MEKVSKAYSYIRFSRPEQMKGDSLRRQSEATAEYCKSNNLVLDDKLTFQDLGLSAFTGVHRTKGALGEFLKLVELGKIEKGSYLIVENLDRLSRQEVLEALNQFTSIIQAGITLVTLQDGMKYSKESITDNWAQLIISITYMARAHDESLRKSQRVSEAWLKKREAAYNGTHIMTSRIPSWLTISKDKQSIKVIPDAQHAIKTIFEKRLSGQGVYSICRELNENDLIWKPPFNSKRKTSGWRESYIKKILRDEAVIGTYIPHRKVSGKRIPEDPIKGYYPAIISEELFYGVQKLLDENIALGNGHGGGRQDKSKNLFTYLAFCGKCKAPMQFMDKGNSPKGGKYLRCHSAIRKAGCEAKAIRYDEFERLIFEDFNELNIASLLPNSDELNNTRRELELALNANRAKLNETVLKIANLIDSITSTANKRVRETLEERLGKLLDDKEQTVKLIEELSQKLVSVTQEVSELSKNLDTSKEIYSLLEQCKNEQERITLRKKLKAELRKLIEFIHVYPLEEEYVPRQEIEPGVYMTMESKFIDKIAVKYRVSGKFRMIFMKRIGTPDY